MRGTPLGGGLLLYREKERKMRDVGDGESFSSTAMQRRRVGFCSLRGNVGGGVEVGGYEDAGEMGEVEGGGGEGG